ncbi:Single-stranded DNA-binding protein [Minicystis rosea]|nr:Single-stranded DNA-binding protein [Minicystis rosea]
MNKVILLGNLGADPELRYTGSGVPVLSFRLATTETWTDKNREHQVRTEWHTVVVWGNRAEGLSKHLAKGSSVLVEGGLRTTSYEKDGQKRYKTEVHARDLYFTSRRATPMGSDANSGLPAGAVMAATLKTGRNGSGGAAPADLLDELPY